METLINQVQEHSNELLKKGYTFYSQRYCNSVANKFKNKNPKDCPHLNCVLFFIENNIFQKEEPTNFLKKSSNKKQPKESFEVTESKEIEKFSNKLSKEKIPMYGSVWCNRIIEKFPNSDNKKVLAAHRIRDTKYSKK